MAVSVVIGAQWGDEGDVVDYLARDAATVVRYQGGNNAGHTVAAGDTELKLHLIPLASCTARPSALSPMASSSTRVLVQEMATIRSQGISLDNLRISGNAHVIMPYHRLLDTRVKSVARQQDRHHRPWHGPAYATKPPAKAFASPTW